ncbi:MAG: hypothetical protein HGB12_15050 [Bacteroidetes bacterium]|nr:hypothetical protein [Bacteroidota bacterium]
MLNIIKVWQVDLNKYNKSSNSSIFCIHLKVTDLNAHAQNLITQISDTSWIMSLGVIQQASYFARSKATIKKLVDDIFSKIEDEVTSDFGEYLVSMTAQISLKEKYNHKIVPISELWNKKVSGNPGFDFHSESVAGIIVFGEAKYNSTSNPYRDAIKQIIYFIDHEKDIMDLVELKDFCSELSICNAHKKVKSYAAAFSLNGKRHDQIFDNIFNSDLIDPLLDYPEIYIIGIEVGGKI